VGVFDQNAARLLLAGRYKGKRKETRKHNRVNYRNIDRLKNLSATYDDKGKGGARFRPGEKKKEQRLVVSISDLPDSGTGKKNQPSKGWAAKVAEEGGIRRFFIAEKRESTPA